MFSGFCTQTEAIIFSGEIPVSFNGFWMRQFVLQCLIILCLSYFSEWRDVIPSFLSCWIMLFSNLDGKIRENRRLPRGSHLENCSRRPPESHGCLQGPVLPSVLSVSVVDPHLARPEKLDFGKPLFINILSKSFTNNLSSMCSSPEPPPTPTHLLVS